MMYLKKYNESNEISISEIIENAFIELIENNVDIIIGPEKKINGIFMGFEVKVSLCSKKEYVVQKKNFNEIVDRFEKALEIIKDTEVCCKRILDEMYSV